MCLIILAIDQHPDYPFILCGNRDEFHLRPTKQADYWSDVKQIFAGRDLEKGGTWLGVTTTGKIAAVTNVRDKIDIGTDFLSRGEIVTDFLKGDVSPKQFIEELKTKEHDYQGYNVIVGEYKDFHYSSNRVSDSVKLDQGFHVISNAKLNTSWPKAEQLKKNFTDSLRNELSESEYIEKWLTILRDQTTFPDEELPHTGVGVELERILSPIFINGEHYGTRASTIILLRRDGQIHFVEQSYGPNAVLQGRKDEMIHLK